MEGLEPLLSPKLRPGLALSGDENGRVIDSKGFGLGFLC